MKSIQQLYPQGQFSLFPLNEEDYFNWFCPNYKSWLCIPKGSISEREQDLISFLLSKEHYVSTWEEWLFSSTIKDSQLVHRFIHFHIEQELSESEKQLFSTALYSLNNNFVDIFFYQPNFGMIVEKTTAIRWDDFDLFIHLFEDDFGHKIKFFIGNSRAISELTKPAFLLELSLFHFLLEKKIKKQIFHNSMGLSMYILEHGLQVNPLTKEILQKIEEIPDWGNLVQALWENQGNISLTAKALFIHRNTLQNKIHAIFEKTELNLKEPHDLLLTYAVYLFQNKLK